MHVVAQRPSVRRSLEVDCFALMGLNHIINSRGKLKMIDISCVGSGVKYHSLSNLSIVMTSPVEFSTGEFSAKQI